MKCHHQVTDVPQAEKLQAGYERITKFGCTGCHTIGGEGSFGPDLTDNRQVGPNLAHLGYKADKDWVAQVDQEPARLPARYPDAAVLRRGQQRVAPRICPRSTPRSTRSPTTCSPTAPSRKASSIPPRRGTPRRGRPSSSKKAAWPATRTRPTASRTCRTPSARKWSRAKRSGRGPTWPARTTRRTSPSRPARSPRRTSARTWSTSPPSSPATSRGIAGWPTGSTTRPPTIPRA